MTFSFLWFAVGVAVGVNVALAGLWWSLRRENRKAARTAQQEMERFTEAWRDLETTVAEPFMPVVRRLNDQLARWSREKP